MAGHPFIIGLSLYILFVAVMFCCIGAALADGGELNVNLQKMKKAETWPSALQGRNTTVDPVTLEGMQKKIMLERFQSEVCISFIHVRWCVNAPAYPHLVEREVGVVVALG